MPKRKGVADTGQGRPKRCNNQAKDADTAESPNDELTVSALSEEQVERIVAKVVA